MPPLKLHGTNRNCPGQWRRYFALLWTVLLAISVQAQQATLIDVNPGANSAAPDELVQAGTRVFFRADDGIHGRELWTSDGTTTAMVLDIRTGSASSNPSNLTAVGSLVYFTAFEPGTGWELWCSDGTPAGTQLVGDINPGPLSSSPTNLAARGSEVLFSANGPGGRELWKGGITGTALVKNIATEAVGAPPNSSFPAALTLSVNNEIFFRARASTTEGFELWKSDGTDAGTVLVKDINPNPFASSSITQLRDFNGTLFFSASDGVAGIELWRSDGSTAGTLRATDIAPAAANAFPVDLAGLGNNLLFQAEEALSGEELYAYDVLTGIATLVKDIRTGSDDASPAALTSSGPFTFFRANDGSNGSELWRTDGTAAGTLLFRNINPTADSNPEDLLSIGNGVVVFGADDGTNGNEVWTSQGSAPLLDINPSGSSNPADFTRVNGLLFFTAETPAHGRELYVIQESLIVVLPAVITLNPQSQTLCPGLAFSLSVAATGANLSYQWRKDGVDIPGATNPTFSVAISTPSDTGTYDAVVSNPAGPIFSSPAIINTTDSTNPILTLPSAAVVQCNTSIDPSVTGMATATDNCDSNPIVTFSDSMTVGACPQELSITRSWMAQDASGNTASGIQTITVVDTVAPVVIAPLPITVECSDFGTANLGTPNVSDNCDPSVVVMFSDSSVVGSCPQAMTVTRTWTATDACGNQGSDTQVITLVDTTGPSITAPGNITVECSNFATANLGQPTVSDNCDPNPNSSFSDSSIMGACAQEMVVVRTWTATDACGNSNTDTQVITVVDTTGPVVTAPGDISVECSDFGTTNLGVASVSDNCDPSPVTNFSDATAMGACPQAMVITRTWTSIDACGNQGTDVQIITIIDTTPPAITAPANLSVECSDFPTANLGTPTVVDNCDPSPSLSFTDSSATGACAQEMVVTRTWTATDACGNPATAIQVITVVDTTPPMITAPASLTLECSDFATANLGQPTVTDNCDPSPTSSFSDMTAIGSCAQEMVITRTWMAMDACGNLSATGIQTITLVDTTPPTITAPASLTVECSNFATANLGLPTVSDNCDPSPMTSFNDVTVMGACAQAMTITRTWTATDACGHQRSDIQTISVVDTTPPTVTPPADITVECSAFATTNLGVATAIDNCDPNPTTSFSDATAMGACAQAMVITRTWTSIDACGNQGTDVQIITIIDTTPPAITAPANLSVECSDFSTANLGTPTVVDNCDPSPSLSFTDSSVTGACAQEMVVTRTWTATDACGNPATAIQVITVVDTTPPMITAPASLTLECSDFATANLGQPTVTDNCDPSPTSSFSDMTAIGSCAQEMVITRTWMAMDACGNLSATDIQTITLVDTTPPTITAPASLTVECSNFATANLGLPTVSDNCDPSPMTSFNDVTVMGACAQAMTITRTWTATDACGHQRSDIQTISVVDTTPPTVTPPADITVECSAFATTNLGVATAIDNCDPNPTTSFSDATAMGACAQAMVITRTWTGLDACGNQADAIQTITVVDTTAPVIAAPGNLTVECSDFGTANLGMPVVSDNCDPAPMITFSDSTAPGACAQRTVVTRTWVATDACGNQNSDTQVIDLIDTTPPVLTGPTALTLECPAAPGPTTGLPTAVDNCDPSPTISFSDMMAPGNCPTVMTITRLWTATDGCGNQGFLTQTISIEDTQPPVFDPFPTVTATIACSDSTLPTNPALGTPTASDGCGTVTSFSFSDFATASGCGAELTITRTWTAIDNCGLSSSLVQTISLVDTDPPLLTVPCPNLPDVELRVGECDRPVTWTPPQWSDNCATPVITSTHQPGDRFGAGVHTVTYSADDGCNLPSTCSFTFTVRGDWESNPVAYSVGPQPSSLVMGDLGRGDSSANPLLPSGDLSLVTTNSNGSLTIRFNDGMGGFDDPTRPSLILGSGYFAPDEIPVAVEIDNFVPGGGLDLAVLTTSTSGNDDHVVIISNDGTNFVSPPTVLSLGTVNGAPVSLAHLDLNGTGAQDFIACVQGNQTTINPRALLISAGVVMTALPLNNGVPVQCAAIDLDNDGDKDIAIVTQSSELLLYENLAGSLTLAASFVGITGTPIDLAVGDLDADLQLDDIVILSENQGAGVLTYFVNSGQGFGPTLFSVSVDSKPASPSPSAVAIGDIRRDSVPPLVAGAPGGFFAQDVVVTNALGTPQSALSNEPLLSFISIDAAASVVDSSAVEACLLGNAPIDVVMQDVNGDSLDDILLLNQGDSTAQVLLSRVRSLTTSLGSPCGSGTLGGPGATLSLLGAPLSNTSFRLQLNDAPPQASTALFASGPPAYSLFGPCDIFVVAPLSLLTPTQNTNAAGSATWPPQASPSVFIPAGFEGIELTFQWLITDPGFTTGFSLSNGLRLRVGE